VAGFVILVLSLKSFRFAITSYVKYMFGTTPTATGEATMQSWIATNVEDRIAVVTMQRPPANAIDIALLEQLARTLNDLAPRTDVAAMVLTGAGKAFSAGLDLKLVPTYDRTQQNELLRVLNQALYQLYALPIPTVAAVNGHAIAGGLVLALACDVRVAVDDGALFGLTEVRAGVPFPVAAMAVVTAELTPATARELVLGGKNHDPARARALGIVDELQPAGQVLARSKVLARELAAAPRQSYGRIKRQLRQEGLAEIERAQGASDPLHGNWIGAETAAAAARVLRGC
jgi:enoyl-CoA hydratase